MMVRTEHRLGLDSAPTEVDLYSNVVNISFSDVDTNGSYSSGFFKEESFLEPVN